MMNRAIPVIAALGCLTALCRADPAQAQSCPAPLHSVRPTGVPKPSSWQLAGAYDMTASLTGNSSIGVDVTGDGRKELLSFGVPGTRWQAYGYSTRTGNYEIVHSERPRTPWPSSDNTSGGLLSAVNLQLGGALKIISSAQFQINDAITHKLEVVGALDPGLGHVWVRDLDGDGTNEIISDDGVVLDVGLTRYKSLPQGGLGSNFGNFDGDANYEMLSLTGGLAEWRGGRWVEDQPAAIQYNGDMLAVTSDIDSDGVDELVYLDGNRLRVHDFAERRLLWEVEVRTEQTSDPQSGTAVNRTTSLAMADVNGDGRPDALVLTEGTPGHPGEVMAFDGRNGGKLWAFTHPALSAGGLVVDNFDTDPALEIAFSAGFPITGPFNIYIHDSATRALEWKQPEELWPVSAFAIADLTAATGPEVIVAPSGVAAEGDTRLYVRDLASMAPLLDLDSAKLPAPTTRGVYAVAVGDVMGGSNVELILSTDDGAHARVHVYSWPARTLLRTFDLDTADNIIVELQVADIDHDGDMEIVAGSGRNSLPRIHAIDARANTLLWSSPPLFDVYGRLPALKVVDLDGDQHPEIIAGGEKIVIFDGVTHAQTRIGDGTGSFTGLDIADVTGDGKLDIIAGRGILNGVSAGGELLVFAAPDWTKVKELKACATEINAVTYNPFETTRRQAFFTCDTRIGIADFGSDTSQIVSYPVALDLGVQNHLHAVRTPGGAPRLLATAKFGAFSLSPIANLPPFIAPDNTCSPQRFFKHWRAGTSGALAYLDPDGDEIAHSIVHTPLFTDFETRTDVLPDLLQLVFGVSTKFGPDMVTLKVSDGLEDSPLAVTAIYVSNSAPTLTGATNTVRAGEKFSAGLNPTDSDGDALTFEVVQAPAHGTLTLNASVYEYRANATYTGTDTFVLRASDPLLSSEPATFTMEVIAATPPAPPQPPADPGSGDSGGKSGGGGSMNLLWLLALAGLAHRGRPRRAASL